MSDENENTANNAQPSGEQGEQGKVFTQQDIDRIVADRVSRTKAQFSDYDNLKTAAQKLAEIEEAQKTEADRLKDLAETATKERDQAREEAKTTLIRAAFVSEAAKAGVAHPDDVYALADKAGVVIEDGKVSGAAEAVKALVDAGRVPMSGKPQAPNLDAGAGSGSRQTGKLAVLTAEEIEAARKMGISQDDYAKQKVAIKRQEE